MTFNNQLFISTQFLLNLHYTSYAFLFACIVLVGKSSLRSLMFLIRMETLTDWILLTCTSQRKVGTTVFYSLIFYATHETAVTEIQ